MPHSHKKKTLAVKRCLAVGLLAIAAAIGVLFGPSAFVLAQGPTAKVLKDPEVIKAYLGE